MTRASNIIAELESKDKGLLGGVIERLIKKFKSTKIIPYAALDKELKGFSTGDDYDEISRALSSYGYKLESKGDDNKMLSSNPTDVKIGDYIIQNYGGTEWRIYHKESKIQLPDTRGGLGFQNTRDAILYLKKKKLIIST